VSGYTFASNLVRKFAHDNHLMGHQMQAVLWVAQKAIADEIEAEEKAAKKAEKDAKAKK
jgi:hypothetical protein